METIGNHIQAADWKSEKHVPVIEIDTPIVKNQPVSISLKVGAEIAHPNTTEHHIRWIQLYFKPEEEKFLIHLGTYNFDAHGESVKGTNEGSARCEPFVKTTVTLTSPGTLLALSYCNIHGLWENSMEVEIA